MDYNSNNIDQSLRLAYENTEYRTFKPELSIRIGQENESLTVFLFDNNAFTWAYVSACNPYSIKISDSENQKRHEILMEQVKNRGWRFLEGEGRAMDRTWAEKSLFILDISKKEALELAQQFEQNAIVFGYFNQKPQLLFCLEK